MGLISPHCIFFFVGGCIISLSMLLSRSLDKTPYLDVHGWMFPLCKEVIRIFLHIESHWVFFQESIEFASQLVHYN